MKWLEQIPDEHRVRVHGGLVRYDLVPVANMAGGLALWIELGIRPTDFLVAVLSANLHMARDLADDNNRPRLSDHTEWLRKYAPPGCWGSPAVWTEWRERRAEARAASHGSTV